MPEPVRTVVIVIAVIIVILYLASATGLLSPLNQPIRFRP